MFTPESNQSRDKDLARFTSEVDATMKAIIALSTDPDKTAKLVRGALFVATGAVAHYGGNLWTISHHSEGIEIVKPKQEDPASSIG